MTASTDTGARKWSAGLVASAGTERRVTGQPRVRWILLGADLLGSAVPALFLLPVMAAPAVPLVWVLVLSLTGSYGPRRLSEEPVATRTLGQVVLVLLVLVELVLAPLDSQLRHPVALCILVGLVVGIVARDLTALRLGLGLHSVTSVPRSIVVVGSPSLVQQTLKEIDESGPGLDVVAVCVLAEQGAAEEEWASDRAESVLDAVRQHRADAVLVLSGPGMTPTLLRRLAWSLEPTPAELLISAGVVDVVARRSRSTTVGSLSLIHLQRTELNGPRRLIKEVWERGAALVALVVLGPVLLALMLAVRLDSPGGALFRQPRLGRGDKPFTMLKLRTMSSDAELLRVQLSGVNEADGPLFKVQADPRITRIGGLLRRYSLDELPQLWNIVRGDMALVGPRPALATEVATYESDVRRRMVVKPGLTGLWQVSGRSDLSWKQSVRLDLYYVDNWSLGLDLVIVCQTVRAVLSHTGAY